MITNVALVTSDNQQLLYQILEALQKKFTFFFEVVPGEIKLWELKVKQIDTQHFESIGPLFYWLGYYVRMYRE